MSHFSCMGVAQFSPVYPVEGFAIETLTASQGITCVKLLPVFAAFSFLDCICSLKSEAITSMIFSLPTIR